MNNFQHLLVFIVSVSSAWHSKCPHFTLSRAKAKLLPKFCLQQVKNAATLASVD